MNARVKYLISVGFICIIGLAIVNRCDTKNSLRGSNIISIASAKEAKSSTNASKFKKVNKKQEEKETSKEDDVSLEDITSINDITDDMILKETLGYCEKIFISNHNDYNLKVNTNYFLGCDYIIDIKAKQKSKITFHYTTTMKKNTLKMALIIGGKKVQYLPIEKQKATYIIPKGITKFVLIGYKANGEINVTMDKVKGIKFIQSSEW